MEQAIPQLTPRERELVALGAALGSNCKSCVEHHIPLARQLGLSEAQIREAVELADQVRQVPARQALLAASQALDGASIPCAADKMACPGRLDRPAPNCC